MHSTVSTLRSALLAAAFLGFTLGAAAAPPAAHASVRIVSLIPSLTEDLFAIGAGPQVVGVSQFSDYPPAAAKVPQVSSFSSIDAEKVLRLHPDVVVGITSQEALTRDLRRLGLRIALMSDDSFDDIFTDLATLGHLSGHEREAAALSARLRSRTQSLVRKIDSRTRPRVFVVIGVAPIFTVGDRSYIAQLVRLAGGRNAATGLRDAYARYSAEALVAAQPDLIVTDHRAGLQAALAQAPWYALRAVRDHRVYVPPNDDMLERPGPRYNDGLAWLIARLHPNAAK
jgi:iron complex transport system substrate-binding protein